MATPDQDQVARIAAAQLGAEPPAPAAPAEAPTTPQEAAAVQVDACGAFSGDLRRGAAT